MTKHKVEIKRRKTYQVNLTKFELLHLRDMLSIVTPPHAKITVSQSLAELENRTHVEQLLWNKVSGACKEAGLPLGDDAPDYIVAPTMTPPLGVFQVSSEPPSDADAYNNFLNKQGDEDEG